MFFSSPINAKKVNATTSSDSYIGLWRNYLILCCSAAASPSPSPSPSSSASTGPMRCSPPETLASTPDSGYSIDAKVCLPRPLCSSDSARGRVKFLLMENKIERLKIISLVCLGKFYCFCGLLVRIRDRDFLLGKIDLVHKNSLLKILKCFPLVLFPSPSTSHRQQESFIIHFLDL